ncbi:MAG: hypothetical protein ABF242_06095 [Flavobacteriales bacterium]
MKHLIFLFFLITSNIFLSQTIESKREEIAEIKKYALTYKIKTKIAFNYKAEEKDSIRIIYETYDKLGCLIYLKNHHFQKIKDFEEKRYKNDSIGRRIIEQTLTSFRPKNYVTQFEYQYYEDSLISILRKSDLNSRRPLRRKLDQKYKEVGLPIKSYDSIGRIKTEIHDLSEKYIYHYSDSGYYEMDLIIDNHHYDIKYYFNNKGQTIAYKSLNDVRKKILGAFYF